VIMVMVITFCMMVLMYMMVVMTTMRIRQCTTTLLLTRQLKTTRSALVQQTSKPCFGQTLTAFRFTIRRGRRIQIEIRFYFQIWCFRDLGGRARRSCWQTVSS
jgi:hypothetical protein